MKKNGCLRKKRKDHNFSKRAGSCDHHHDKPSSRGGESLDSNKILMDLYRHDAYHLLFKNRTINEIVFVLKQHRNVKSFMKAIDNYYKWQALKLLFPSKKEPEGYKTLTDIINLLERINRAKFNQKIKSIKLARIILAA
jgi:hypothetical protein